jgi:ankyrin repeat protein
MTMAGVEVDYVHLMKGAVVCGDVEQVRALLDLGCSVEMNVNNDKYPHQLLAFAVRSMQYEICQLLISRGADAKGWPQHNSLPLREAAGALGPRGVATDTLEHRLALCSLLLVHGAEPNALGSGGSETALHMAMRCGSSEAMAIDVLRVLVRHGGDPSYAPAGAGSGYETPLQTAVRMGNVEIVRFFFDECQQDPFAKTISGRSLLQHCSGFAASECREVIRESQRLWRSSRVKAEVVEATGDAAGSSYSPSRSRSGFSPI